MENIPDEPPFVVIANHTSHLDTIVLSAMLPARWRGRVFPVAAGDTFFVSRPRAVFLTTVLNLLQLKRRAANRHALEHLRTRVIEEQLVIILFPEGTRGNGSELASFKPGIGKLVAGTNIAVVPCALCGCESALPKGKRLPRPRRIELRVDAPELFSTSNNDRASWDDIASQLQQRIQGVMRGE